MRKDMGKVILERRRVRGLADQKGRKREMARIGLEDLPTRESMRAGWKERKERRDRRTPLLRFLRSQVGRPWNEVYSELCYNVRRDSYARCRILDLFFLLDVQVDTVLIEGVPHQADGTKIYDGDFWVHPITGVLMAPTCRPRYRHKHRRTFSQVPVDALSKFVKINDIWYLVHFAPLPESKDEKVFDVAFKEELTEDRHGRRRHRCQSEWGGHIYAVRKSQLNKRQIRGILEAA